MRVIGNLLKYTECQKCQIRGSFDKAIAKIERYSILPHTHGIVWWRKIGLVIYFAILKEDTSVTDRQTDRTAVALYRACIAPRDKSPRLPVWYSQRSAPETTETISDNVAVTMVRLVSITNSWLSLDNYSCRWHERRNRPSYC